MELGDILLKKLVFLLVLVVAGVLGWGIFRKSTPPSIPFSRVKRETLVSTLPTNGKVEPFQWQMIRAEAAGVISKVNVVEGQSVTQGAVIALMTDPSRPAEIDTASARISEARANIKSLEAGLKPAELAEIDNSIARLNIELQQAERTRATTQALVTKSAATQAELIADTNKVEQVKADIEGMQKKRKVATPVSEIDAAQARLMAEQSALNLAQQKAAQIEVRARMSGVIYGLAVRAGAYVNTGDLIGNVGVLGRLRVRVYIDEPELGRVALGQPVTITWQALAGKQWNGTVEKKPTSIEPLGSRQVGQVLCDIDNDDGVLIPGTNVDATIRTGVAEGAIVAPKEALRHDPSGDYVFLLKGDAIERRPVKTGISSVTRIQILQGLAEGDDVAMPSDTPMKSGMKVTAVR